MNIVIPILAAVLVVSTATAQTNRQIEQIIQDEGEVSFTDRSSIFTFKDTGDFTLNPIGISGRTISGVWTNDGHGFFIVTGQWSWVNGISKTNDHRMM